MASNKIKYGIRNVYYAQRTESGGSYTYGSPIALPGAVSLSLAPEGDSNSFYADDVEYYRTDANNGYSGDLEIANIPDSFRVYALGEVMDNNDVLIEDADAAGKEFALGFEIQGSDHNTLFWFYNCVVSRPDTNASTKESSIDPQTDTLSISCRPDENYVVRAKTTDETAAATKTGWFGTVYEPDL